MADLQSHAQRIATRVDSSVGLDPATIIAILTTVLPLLINCFRHEEPAPAEVAEAIRDAHARNPRRLQVRTTRSVKSESKTKLTHDQAEEIAIAIIDDCLNQDDNTVSAVFA